MQGEEGVSPVVGTLLMLGIFISIGATVFFVARPHFIEVQEDAAFDGVTDQMKGAASEIKGLAVSGLDGAVKKPVMTLPGGEFLSERGHWYAVSVGVQDENYGKVAGESFAPGAHHDFYVEEWTPDAVSGDTQFNVYNNATFDIQYPTYLLQRFENGRWSDEKWDKPANILGADKLVKEGGSFHTVTTTEDLADTTYRLRISNNNTGGSEGIIGEIYLYPQDRLAYHYGGESGLRSLYSENGAVWTVEQGKTFSRQAGLILPPAKAIGTGHFTMRTVDLNVTGAAGGHAKLALLMNLVRNTDLALDQGASIVRIQIAGPDTETWRNTFYGIGLFQATDEAKGAYHIHATEPDGHRKAFPFNFIHTEIDLRIRSQ
ncbi:MAG: type IV pilin N-terminal domain-containing protein [Euryarchaeota archaeon]|nr:type IV pilin N-terminal domain-containing protein [Euryarchaeota archaeon]